jgi:hypothetical protein
MDRADIERAYRPILARKWERGRRREPGGAMLDMEKIGDTAPRVFEIYDYRPGEFVKHEVAGLVDYSRANRIRTRGVRRFFCLTPGRIYEVIDPRSWKRTEHYYCHVRGGEIVRMEIGEVFAWLHTARIGQRD